MASVQERPVEETPPATFDHDEVAPPPLFVGPSVRPHAVPPPVQPQMGQFSVPPPLVRESSFPPPGVPMVQMRGMPVGAHAPSVQSSDQGEVPGPRLFERGESS